MYQEILNNYCMGFISARETAGKLIEAGFPEDMQTVLNEKIRENMERIRIEERSFLPAVNEVNEILAVTNYDRTITSKKIVLDGILVQQFLVYVFASWTEKSATFEFDNYCAADNTENLKGFKKFVEEN